MIVKCSQERARIFFFAACGWLACGASASAQDLIGVTWLGDAVRIDVCGGTSSFLGPTGYTEVNSLARSGDGKLIAASKGPQPRLIEIDLVTGAGSFLAFPFLNDVRALAFAPGKSDELLLANADGTKTWLFTLDLSLRDPAPVLLSQTTIGGIVGLTYSPDGVLYAWSTSGGLLIVDEDSGTCTDVNGLVDGSSQIQSLAFDDGSLFGAYEAFFAIDALTGAVSPVGSSGLAGVRGLERIDTAWFQDCSFVPSTGGVSVASGGIQTLGLDAGPGQAGNLYFVLGSATGTAPALDVGAATLHLHVDGYFLYTLQNPFSPPLSAALGFLDASGRATASFGLGPGSPPSLVGLRLNHAYFTIDASGLVGFASPPVIVELLP